MFELNKYLIGKMGWISYSQTRGISFVNNLLPIFAEDPHIRYFFNDKLESKLYIIRELTKKGKQKSKNLYKFIVIDYALIYNNYPSKIDISKFPYEEFANNIELFGLIIKYEACNEVYQRHFRINKLLK